MAHIEHWTHRVHSINRLHLFSIQAGVPKKKLKTNGIACAQQPKNTVAMLNELRQGLVYNLEGQSGPVHAPVFTMTVEVCHKQFIQTFKQLKSIWVFSFHSFYFRLIARWKRLMVKNTLVKGEVRSWHAYRRPNRHYGISFNSKMAPRYLPSKQPSAWTLPVMITWKMVWFPIFLRRKNVAQKIKRKISKLNVFFFLLVHHRSEQKHDEQKADAGKRPSYASVRTIQRCSNRLRVIRWCTTFTFQNGGYC